MSDESKGGAGDAGQADRPADYETAAARLDEIIARLDSGDAQLRETLDLCAEAKTLIEYCATELAAVDDGLKELRLEDLAESLQSGSAGERRPSPDE
ncbi:MAG: exodeoxyribonuclease VII small subunit [Solirubrobacterales bacterium]|nr:exodeoxyribonuclease VII small subunit [Solirubrobacterales bacterium]